MGEAVTTGVKLDEETRARLKALGEVRDRSPHYLMRRAIQEFLDREEAKEAERRLTLQRWEAYQQTGRAVEDDVAEAWLRDLAAGRVRPCPSGG